MSIRNKVVSARESRLLARKLKASGYKTATRNTCRRKVADIISDLEPYGGDQALRLEKKIARILGYRPTEK